MKTLTKLLALLLVLASLVGVLAGCGGETPDVPNNDDPNNAEQTEDQGGENVEYTGEPLYGGELNVRISSRPTGIDPMKQTGAFRILFTSCVFDTPLTRDAQNNIAPGTCDYELSEDHLVLKMWMREGFVFSNGDPVDIYDVEASINRTLKLFSEITKYVKPNIDSIAVANDGEKDVLTVTFKQVSEKNMYYFAAYQTFFPVMPVEICEQYKSSYLIDQIEDAIGSGPYKYTYFEDSVRVSVAKREDYVPVDNGDRTGFASTRYGYMDQINFWYNGTDASTSLGLLNGDYDVAEVLVAEYKDMAAQQGLTLTTLPSDQRTWITFNTVNAESPCAKYPSLRKAILAALDYDSYLDVVQDGAQIFEGENAQFLLGSKYATDAFTSQDYYGPANQEVVDKYLALAEEEGYKGEPVQVTYHSGRDDIPTLLCDALSEYGIAYELETKEPTVYSAYTNDPSNGWDLFFNWATTSYTPGTLQDNIMQNNYKSEEKDRMLAELAALDPESEEYKAKWEELAQYTADGAYVGFLAAIDWWWWHPTTLHINESGNGLARYFFNAYWEDPQNHPVKTQ